MMSGSLIIVASNSANESALLPSDSARRRRGERKGDREGERGEERER